MKKLFYISYLLVIIVSFQSCEKMIEIDPPTDQINTNTVFKDKRSALSVLANLYINLRESSMYTGGAQGLGTILGLYTDELEDLSNSPSSDNFILHNNTLDPTRQIISSLWNNSYSHIYAINSFIIGVNNSDGIGEDDKQQLIAEAYILRAMYYQGLTQIFGDIPYTTSINYKDNTFIGKTPSINVLQYIEQDLLIAESTLSYNYRSSDKYYPNKAVVELILSKNYLLQKKYDKAEYYAQLLIKNTFFSIESDITKVFKKNAKSTLWQLSNSSPTAATYEARNYIMIINDWMYKLSNSLVSSLNEQDLRKINWTKNYSQTENRYAFKYKNTPPNNTDECSILYRIEEAYFILSEALIHQNREKEAISYLNMIRQRSNLTPLQDNLSKEQILLAMLNESSKEFFLEHGRRFFDLKRNNKLSILTSSKPNWQNKHILFPYPEKELLINPNLNPQNDY